MAFEFYPESYNCPEMSDNYEAAAALMNNLNYSGMLSTKLIETVWKRTYISLENVRRKYLDKNPEYAEHDFNKDIEAFENIFKNIAIFSENFYYRLYGLFLTTLKPPKVKELSAEETDTMRELTFFLVPTDNNT